MRIPVGTRERLERAVVGGAIGGASGLAASVAAYGVALLFVPDYDAFFVLVFGAWALGILGAIVGSATGAARSRVPSWGRMAAASLASVASCAAAVAMEFAVGDPWIMSLGGIPTLAAFAATGFLVSSPALPPSSPPPSSPRSSRGLSPSRRSLARRVLDAVIVGAVSGVGGLVVFAVAIGAAGGWEGQLVASVAAVTITPAAVIAGLVLGVRHGSGRRSLARVVRAAAGAGVGVLGALWQLAVFSPPWDAAAIIVPLGAVAGALLAQRVWVAEGSIERSLT